MKLLQEKILTDGRVLSSHILKVDSFLNHQVDPTLTMAVGQAFARAFQNAGITKVLTIEASGIHFALATSVALGGVPFVYAKKKKAVTQSDAYVVPVHSFTRGETFQVSVGKSYLEPSDRILIVDDFLATGDALLGLTEIVKMSGAQLVGIGSVIEKSFQDGRRKLEEAGVRVHSLARIGSMSPEDGIQFLEENQPAEEAHTAC